MKQRMTLIFMGRNSKIELNRKSTGIYDITFEGRCVGEYTAYKDIDEIYFEDGIEDVVKNEIHALISDHSRLLKDRIQYNPKRLLNKKKLNN